MINSNRTANANLSPRCSHIKTNGLRCGAPARSGRTLCCFHDSAAQRNHDFFLPIVEDHASFQLAINKVLQAVLDKLIDQKTANSLLYGLQIAYVNLKPLRIERHTDDFNRRQKDLAQELAGAAAAASERADQPARNKSASARAASEEHDFTRANQPAQTDSALAAEGPKFLEPPHRVLTVEEAYGWKEEKRCEFEEFYAKYFPEMPKPPQSIRQAIQEALGEESSG